MNSQAAVVYIVDDDESVRRSLERLIRSAGMTVQAFTDAREFLKVARLHDHACVVADIRMRGMTGLELQKELKNLGSSLPVILLTAHDVPDTREEAKKTGAAGYFRKPVDAQALLDSIDWALSDDSSGKRTDK